MKPGDLFSCFEELDNSMISHFEANFVPFYKRHTCSVEAACAKALKNYWGHWSLVTWFEYKSIMAMGISESAVRGRHLHWPNPLEWAGTVTSLPNGNR